MGLVAVVLPLAEAMCARAPLAGASIPGSPVSGSPISPAVRAAPVVQEDVIRIVSFNIRHGRGEDGAHVWSNRREIVSTLLRETRAPLIGLQEVLDFQVDALERAMPSHVRLGVGRDDGHRAGEFSPLFVDTTRFVVLTSGTFWLSETPTVPGSMHWGNRITRITTWARLVDRMRGDTLRVYNGHWDHESQPSRERSAALLLARVAGDGGSNDRVLVLGDFNAGEANAAFRALLSDARVPLRDSYRVRHPEARVVGTFNAFRGDSTGEKIDAVLVGAGWDVLDAAIDRQRMSGLWPSDHFPVRATVRARRER
jgi:endonuclease/exonuclease/phosphatase family metal-dependent hydrolase